MVPKSQISAVSLLLLLWLEEKVVKSEATETMFSQSFDETFLEIPFLDLFNRNEHQGRGFVGLKLVAFRIP